jgi:hypothetical protein
MFPKKLFKLCLVIPAVFFMSASVSADGFVLGLYGAQKPQDLKIIRQAGFNTFQTYDKKAAPIAALAKEAKAQGLKMLAYPNNIINSQYAKEAQTWPVYAWYLIDEPDIFNTPFSKLAEKDTAAKNAFPAHKTAFVLSEGAPKINYYPAADIVMVDWYPVPHLALESLGEQTAKARAGMIKAGLNNKPLIAVVQAFDWKDFKQYRPDNDRIGRYPTPEEINFMSFHSLLSGADGLFYFTLSEARKTPQKWAALTKTVQQLKYLSPVFERGKPLNNPSFIAAPLMAKHFFYDGKRWLIFVNPTAKPVPAPKELLSIKYKTLFAARPLRFTIAQNGGNIPPYAVFILQY